MIRTVHTKRKGDEEAQAGEDANKREPRAALKDTACTDVRSSSPRQRAAGGISHARAPFGALRLRDARLVDGVRLRDRHEPVERQPRELHPAVHLAKRDERE
eukprot:5692057-Prymnesium_polylepis.1